MEETYQIRALVLNRQPFREYDSKITVYSGEQGRLELVARGTRKIKSKLAGHLEPLTISQIMAVRGKQYDYVGSAINEFCFQNIKNDYQKIGAAGEALGFFIKTVKPGEADKNIFEIAKQFLNLLDGEKLEAGESALYSSFFVYRLLVELGHMPELYHCVICKKKISPHKNKFDFSKGGVVCGQCSRQGVIISNDAIKVLRLAADADFAELKKIKINDKLNKELTAIINKLIVYQY